jgi:hypothetical protein
MYHYPDGDALWKTLGREAVVSNAARLHRFCSLGYSPDWWLYMGWN